MCGTIAGVTEFAWNPETYVQRMAQEVTDCPLLQEQLVATTLEPRTRRTGLGGQQRSDCSPGTGI